MKQFDMDFSRFNVNMESIINYYRDVGIPPDFYPDQPFIIRTMMYRKKINMNTFILIVGNPRSSKSYAAMKIAEVYCELNGQVFDVEKQLTFSYIKKFLLWSQYAIDSLFVLDETGTTLSPDSFWSLQQRIMRRFVQTQGFRKNVLIWVLPSIVFIQKGFRFMSNYALLTRRQGVADVYKIVVNQLIGKGFPDRIETMSYRKPSKETEDKYIELKKTWNDAELQDDIDWINELEKPTQRIKIKLDTDTGDLKTIHDTKYVAL